MNFSSGILSIKSPYSWYSFAINYKNILQDVVIQQSDEIRLRIVGTRVDANDIVSWHFFIFSDISLSARHLL